jgi:hypothetical protein
MSPIVLATCFHGKINVLILTKKRVVLGDFFITSSGHPALKQYHI